MLVSLHIRDFAIVDRIDVEFRSGMTVLTGETGAGKSILVDAVGLVLGDRGSSKLVRSGADRAEFSAAFDVSTLRNVQDWLTDNALDQDDECLLRRVINSDGRSRAFVNGKPVTMQQLKALGEMLLDIHGQHFHQSLGRRPVQRDLLDHFGGLTALREETGAAFDDWQALCERLDRLHTAAADRSSQIDLLSFQLQELQALDAGTDEFKQLQAERQRLKNSGRIADGVATALASLSEQDNANANSALADASRAISRLVDCDDSLAPVLELIESASIQVAEANDSLQRYRESIDTDPARHGWVEDRLDAFQTIARKHRVSPDELPAATCRLQEQLDELTNAETRGEQLRSELAAAASGYDALASRLLAGRQQAASALGKAVSKTMDGLGMAGGTFEVELAPLADGERRRWGTETVEFLISANAGQPVMPLAAIASGGELSRMSLAVQVIASSGSEIPTMVFDEVDSGVGGRVAEMVGRRLRELGENRQVLCVTHLPQVASLANQHFRISKVTDGKSTRTRVQELSGDERVEELARMLGGVDITQKTLDHAAEMLAGARRKRA
jgi:DNA repair protein RecN (Recombination protein N)